jgi:hypothetical protein
VLETFEPWGTDVPGRGYVPAYTDDDLLDGGPGADTLNGVVDSV